MSDKQDYRDTVFLPKSDFPMKAGPTFNPPKELLEPHFFDFDGDLYGQTVEVELVSFARGRLAA